MSLLEVRDLKVHFPIRKGLLLRRTVGHVHAVDGVSISVERGQTYGLVGESGCGKSTVGRAILRLNDITDGEVWLADTDLASLSGELMRRMRHRLQMVFQDPMGSLDPRQNVESILTEGLVAHGLGGTLAERRKALVDVLDAVGLPTSALARYPHEFSGGQRQRIGIARALVLQPDVIICDEPVSALDVSVQAQVLNLLKRLQEHRGLTYIFISHDLSVVKFMADMMAVMQGVEVNGEKCGRIVEFGPSETIYKLPKQEYTRDLIAAAPKDDLDHIRRRQKDRETAMAKRTGQAVSRSK